MQPLRIGYVLKRYPRYSETFIVNEILALEKAGGIELTIFALRPCNDTHFQELIAKVRAPVHYLPAHGLSVAEFWQAITEAAEVTSGVWSTLAAAGEEDPQDIYQALLLARELRLQGIGHLHAHFATVATRVAHLAASIARVPYSFTAHAKDIYHESVDRGALAKHIERALFVVTVSDYNRRYLEDLLEAEGRQGRIVRIYNGIDLSLFQPVEGETDPELVVTVGRLVEKKGFGDLIAACGRLKEAGRRVRCAIVGEGEERVSLERQIAACGLEETVSLVGAKTQSEVIRILQCAAMMVLPCAVGRDGNRDGLPTVLLEAMALGVPVISTRVTGIPEMIADGESGLLVDERDPNALAEAMMRLLDSAPLRGCLRTAALVRLRQAFDLRRNVAVLRSVFLSGNSGREDPLPLC
jgi:colanic acid/amylovoran biosynthesis glycosyltransferase